MTSLAVAAASDKPAIASFPEVKDLPSRHDLPDVMTMADGPKVTTLEQWRQRREEMKEIQFLLAARPVYEFLGVSTDRMGVNCEPHRHGLTADDWKAALDFADQQLRGIDHHRTFDQFPTEQTPTNTVAPK